jgi:hypothetical protein
VATVDHDIGDAVRLWAAFYDELGAQAAPDTVTLIVRDPSDNDTTISNGGASAGDLAIASAAVGATLAATTGVYKAVVNADEAGVWWYEWTGTGTVDEVQSGFFEVRRRPVEDPA